MLNFTFQNPTRMIFGKNTHQDVGKYILPYSDKILLVYGGASANKSGLLAGVKGCLAQSNIAFAELGGVQPNPRLALVYKGIALCREQGLDFVLAVGGGSVIDTAKAIAAGVLYDGDVWDFYETDKNPERALPIGTILTMPAAGSEVSPSTVITKEDGLLKYSFSADCVYPAFSILNPELTYTMPKYQLSSGVVDIFTHITERYFTPTRDVDFIDRWCEGALQTLIKFAPIALDDVTNYAARAEIMLAGSLVHNELLSCGRQGDWASHVIEHELSALYDVAHGAGLAVIHPAWMKHVYKNDLSRFAQYAHRVFGVEYDTYNPEWTALEGIRRTQQFFRRIEMPITLGELGITDNRIEEMSQRASKNGTVAIGGFVPIYKEDIVKIFELAK